MDKQWYVTFGVKGGEFAVKAEYCIDAWNEFDKHVPAVSERFFKTNGFNDIPQLKGVSDYCVRPAPSDLVDWIENIHGKMVKVPGGWIATANKYSAVFIPVALAAGITVIEDG